MNGLLRNLIGLVLLVFAFSNNGMAQRTDAVEPDYIPRFHYAYYAPLSGEGILTGLGVEGRVAFKNKMALRMGFNFFEDKDLGETVDISHVLFDLYVNSEADRSGYYASIGFSIKNLAFGRSENDQTTSPVGVNATGNITGDTKFSLQVGFGGQIMIVKDFLYIYNSGNYIADEGDGSFMYIAGIDIRI